MELRFGDLVCRHGAELTSLERWPGPAPSTRWVACIPTRDEAARTAATVRARDDEFGLALHVLLLINDTSDETFAVVQCVAHGLPCALTAVCVGR